MFEDDDLDLSPEVLCSISRRRARAALLTSDDGNGADAVGDAAMF